MVIYIDIDDTICIPIFKNIQKANKLYETGHTIIYWTARGTQTKIDWSDTTKKQFKEWGVKYHDIQFGKPYYDLFIDDKNINVKDWI